MHSFIITLTCNGTPIIFRLAAEKGLENIYEVSAINNKSYPPFLMKKQGGGWKIFTDTAAEIKLIEEKLSNMINAYLEGKQQ